MADEQLRQKEDITKDEETEERTSYINDDNELEEKEEIAKNENKSTRNTNEKSEQELSDEESFLQETDGRFDDVISTENWYFNEEDRKGSIH